MRRKNREPEYMRRVAVYEDEESVQPRKRRILFPVLITLFSVIFVVSAAVLVIELIVNPYVTDKNVGEIQEIYSEAGDTESVAPVSSEDDTADSERMAGLCRKMGYTVCNEPEKAKLILVNTCAVREHAEMRVLGNVGQLNHSKKQRPGQIIAVCGCMVQQEHMTEKIKKSYPVVDLVFGPHELWRFPELLLKTMTGRKRVFAAEKCDGYVAEGMPLKRDSSVKAWLSIMYGCNNFCTYCVVPYVRGRERSRRPEDILAEARQLVESGCRDITLLGQNVNSYGKDLEPRHDFADLLRELDKLDGDFLLRFMSSQPKDATHKLFDAMARSRHVAKQLHLPVQSGCDRVLRAMNRPYDRAKYLDLITYARKVMPDLVLTSDVIIGFPGETEAEAMETVALVEEVRFDALFTFIFSPRPGTPAAKMDDPVPRAEKQKWFDRLCDAQNKISEEIHAGYVGDTLRCLIDGESDDSRWPLTARTAGGRLVHLVGDRAAIGTYRDVKITDSNTWALFGQLI